MLKQNAYGEGVPADSTGRFVEQPILPRLERHTVVLDCGYITPCWVWTGGFRFSNHGARYGRIGYRGRSWKVHRLVYELFVGPLIDGLTIDHKCVNTMCHNPDHLEQVTQRENNRRSTSPSALNAIKTHCVNGHEFTVENTYPVPAGGRACRECRTAACRRYKERRRAQAVAA